MVISLKEIFSIVDGRLFTTMEDVHKILNYIFDTDLDFSEVGDKMLELYKINPPWFQDIQEIVNTIKLKEKTNDYNLLVKAIDNHIIANVRINKLKK